MKLTRRQLRKIILTEMFEKGSAFYPFKLIDKIIEENEPLEFEYKFSTDDGLNYIADIKLHWSSSYGYESEWDVNFDVETGVNNPLGDYALTGSNDLKVLNTIIEIVKDFVSSVRPTLPDPFNQIIDFFAFVAEEETKTGKRDTRRARIYKYMMKKRGINSDISYDPVGNLMIKFQI